MKESSKQEAEEEARIEQAKERRLCYTAWEWVMERRILSFSWRAAAAFLRSLDIIFSPRVSHSTKSRPTRGFLSPDEQIAQWKQER